MHHRQKTELGSRTVVGRALDSRRNSLNALRLIFALMVIVSHAWPIGDFGTDPALAGFSLGGFGVAGFFAISGYLITESRAQKNLTPYLVARALRILPGLWVALLAVAFIGAPLAAVASGGWSLRAAAEYAIKNCAVYQVQPAVGSTLRAQPLNDWNGSLWTLFFEVLCYLCIGLIFLSSAIQRNPRPYLVVAFTVTVGLAIANKAHVFDGRVVLVQGSSVVPFFFAGALIWAYRDRVPSRPSLASLAAVVTLALILTKTGTVIVGLPLAYLVLWLGQALPGWTQKVNNPNDISYGVYIYAFPVTQLLVIAGVAKAGPGVLSLVAAAVTVPVAATSWFVVERPAKRLGRRMAPGYRRDAMPMTGHTEPISAK